MIPAHLKRKVPSRTIRCWNSSEIDPIPLSRHHLRRRSSADFSSKDVVIGDPTANISIRTMIQSKVEERMATDGFMRLPFRCQRCASRSFIDHQQRYVTTVIGWYSTNTSHGSECMDTTTSHGCCEHTAETSE